MHRFDVPLGFIGRDQELAVLRDKLRFSRVLIIAGMAGMGKTTLAAAFAAEIEKGDSLDSPVLWLECKPGWGSADFLDAIVHGLARLSGKEKYSISQSRSFDEAADGIEECRTAVFIDDFHLLENDETLNFLVTCRRRLKTGALVVISRVKPDLPPAERADVFQLDLKGLSDKESLALSGQLLGFHGVKNGNRFPADLAGRLNGHPYSLKLLAGLMISGGSFDPARDQDNVTAMIEKYLFPTFWESTDERLRKLLGCLSLMRTPSPRTLLDRILNHDTGEHLKYLSDRFLIESCSAGVFLHNLLSGFVSRKLDSEERKSMHWLIGQRLREDSTDPEAVCEAYHHLFESGDRKTAVSVLTSLASRLHYLGSEIVTLENLIDHALRNCRGVNDQHLLFLKTSILIRRKKFADAGNLIECLSEPLAAEAESLLLFSLDRHEDVLNTINRLPVHDYGREAAASLICRKAHSLVFLGRIDEALECTSELNLGLDQYSPMIRATYYFLMTKIYYFRADMPRVLEYTELETGIHKELKNWKRLTTCLHNLAHFQMLKNQNELAISLSEEYLKIAEEHSDLENLALCFYLRSYAHLMLGDFDKAVDEARKSLSFAVRCENSLQAAIQYGHLAWVEIHLGCLDEAESDFQKSLQILAGHQNILYLTEIRLWYSGLLLVTGRIQEALSVIGECREFSVRTAKKESLAFAAFMEHLCFKCLGNDNQSRLSLEEYHKIIRQMDPEFGRYISNSLDWFERNTSQDCIRKFTVFNLQGNKSVNRLIYEKIFSKRSEFEIFADFSGKVLMVDGRELEFFGKRTLVPLLQVFATQPGVSLTTKEIFRSVWGRDYSPSEDSSTFRMTLSRLRTLLDKDNLNRFISQTDESGTYRFNDQVNLCVVFQSD
ncbi:MAG: AAA family ATPase [Candidatus Wallbacteria bacterium]|nr:AAA family ATPase [Candidatus Wallbacteria bacterium]